MVFLHKKQIFFNLSYWNRDQTVKLVDIFTCTIFRHSNIVPYDHNRVILKNSINDCDYINATWIKNEQLKHHLPTFIAAQGPLPQTVPHFLQMIVENKVKIIVMLTLLKETDKGNMDEQISKL